MANADQKKAADLLDQALTFHEKGDYAASCTAYQQLLKAFPKDVNGLTNFGLLHLLHGYYALAVPLFEQSLKLYPKQPQTWVDLATALQKTGKQAAALVAVDRAIALEPEMAQAYQERALILLDLGQLEEGAKSASKLIALRPDSTYGHNILGFALHRMGRHAEAVASYERVLTAEPNSPEILSDKGASLLSLKRYDEALACFEQAIAMNPAIAAIHNNRGNALKALRRTDEALAAYDAAVTLDPAYADAHNNRSLVLNNLERWEEALASVDHALALQPDLADAYSNRGLTLRGMKRYDEALADFDRAIALRPDMGNAYWNKATLLILLGQYEEGWKNYEWRWKTELMEDRYRPLQKPLWLGETPIAGKTILVQIEQGFGDFIQFCRYVPMLESQGATVIMETTAPLLPLAKTLSSKTRFITHLGDDESFDVYCPLMSLPYAFRTTVETVPSQIPYLSVDPQKHAQWLAKLGGKTKLRVGLVWSGSASHTNDNIRSVSLAQLRPLLDLPYEFHSMQKEMRASDAALFAQLPQLHTHAEDLKDFSDTAALVSLMDVVITVDTSVAHLAGALGKPVWIMIATAPDYRWMYEREDTPWYPSARLLRQNKSGAWESVIARAVTMLVAFANGTSLAADDAATALQRAVTMVEQKDYSGAIANAQQALALDPTSVKAWMTLAYAQQEDGLYAAAVASYDRLIALMPSVADVHRTRANALAKLGQLDEALQSLNRAIALKPEAALYNNRGNLLHEMGRFVEAMADYNKAIALDPALAEIYVNKAMLVLLQGDLMQGWGLHEWRMQTKTYQKNTRQPDVPLWLGETAIAGKTLLIHPEQGYGDYIQMCRFVSALQATGAKIVLEAAPPLMSLLANLAPDITLVEKGGLLPPIDLHCPVMSLPLALGVTQEKLPGTIPYLAADAAKAAAWEARLGTKTRPRIGLAWSGSPTHAKDRARSITLATLTLLTVFPYDFHSLQKDVRATDAAALAQLPIAHHGDELHHFADTAALIAAMDLVITVDTSVAHLAGAMGKPTWLLLPQVPDWRWMLERSDTPWYPTMRLFRQPLHADWASVMAQVADALPAALPRGE